MRPLLLALAVLLPLGCRDAVVDPPFTPEPAVPGLPPVEAIYLKGPTALGLGQIGNFRGEPRQEIVRYRWGYSGRGRIISGDAPDARVFNVRATAEGEIRVFIQGFDAANELVGVGEKVVLIR